MYMKAFNGVYYHNNYDASPYGGQLFKTYKYINKLPDPNYSRNHFIKKYGLESCFDTSLILLKIQNYYWDFNEVLKRFRNGIRDPLISLLNRRIYFFSYENRFNTLLNLWDDIFSLSFERYLVEVHPLYDESYGLHYKDYFDNHILGIFYEVYLEVQKNSRHTEQIEFKFKEKIYINSYLSEEEVVSLGLLAEQPEYQLDYVQELAFQNDSLRLLTTH